ncbi:MAG: LicD family protein [Clostridia bacterium]|nr:LicD family protein [Clostridia bacterium]
MYDEVKLKSKLVDMMKWFHQFCEENSLTYYAVGGTMLGAVRHKGFIPWDDDIDVGMPREDYNKLCKLIGNRLTGKYYLETPETEARDFFYPYGKLYDTTTTLAENTALKIKRGIFIDIFPLDGLGDTEQEASKYLKKVLWFQNFYLARVLAVRKGRSFIKNAATVVVKIIPQFIINDRNLRLKLVDKCRKFGFYDFEYVSNITGNWGMKEMMPREFFGEPTLYDFEDMRIYGAQNYEGYLKSLYGDWRKLPPKEKRVTHHDFILMDLDKSYLTDNEDR